MTDRDALIARIDRAAEAGLIGEADRNIRVTNVKHAQSETELELIARDLDQLEGTLQPAAPWVGPPSTSPVPVPGAPGPVVTSTPGPAPQAGATVGKVVLMIGCAFALIVAAVIVATVVFAFVAIRGATSGGDVSSGGIVEQSEGPAYGLDRQGIADFLATYQERFGTGEAVELVMYDDYAVAQVPVEGKARSAGWIYRGRTWQEFGDTRASFPGAEPVDLGRIDVDALVGNIERARTTLGVAEISTTYVVVHDYSAEEPPQMYVYVSNEYGETGYLATRPGGAVVRAYPFDQ